MENQEKNITLLEAYFPKDWESLILPSRIKTILTKTKEKVGYRLLLYSSPGTGKTTTSRLMTLGSEYESMYLSGSNDFNVETYRKVMAFSAGFSVLQKQKCVIIDEAENIRDNLQDAFKILFDKATNTNFIFITNEVEKINDALFSRFTAIDYDFNAEDLEEHKRNFISFALKVCNENKIQFDKPGLKALFQLNFPDFRHLLVNLQEFMDSTEIITVENVKKLTESGKQIQELYDLVENPAITAKELYSEMSKFKGKEKDCLSSLGEPFFEYLNSKNMFEKTLESAIIVNKYYDSYMVSINKFVTLMSCIIELKTLFR